MTIFATLTPIDLGTNTRVTVRLCAVQDVAATGAGDQRWWPAIVTMPVIQSRFFDGDFSSSVQPASANMAVRLDVLIAGGQFPGVELYDWAGASCLLQRLSGGVLVDVQQMQVESFASEDFVLGLNLQAAGDLFDAEVLRSRYAGTTGAEGGADLRGQLKPWAFGRCLNVEPVFIDQIDSVFQVSGYGPVSAIPAVYERGNSFGASIGNFANYAALVAASIPPGRWGTCLAEGMFRLGAPPAGVITCDVDGDNVGGFLRRTGAILSQIATRIGLVDKVNAASMTALDTAVARNVNIVLREQTSFMELAQRMLAPCNAVASVGSNGRLIASRAVFGAEQFTLDAQGREMPPVLGMARQNTSAPYKRIQMGAARSWRVHTFDEIAFFADLIDRGLYVGAEVYREGNIVESADKSRWVYVNPTASAGNAPPTWPTASNAFWQNIAPPISGNLIGSIVAPANANRVPYSQFEQRVAWYVSAVFGVTGGALTFASSGGYQTLTYTANSPGPGNFGSFKSARFPVSGGERLSCQARMSTNIRSECRVTIRYFDASGSPIVAQPEVMPFAGIATPSQFLFQGFTDAPGNAVAGEIEAFVPATAAGALSASFSQPMITSAAAGQTVHPPFSPGPNAEDAADITATVNGAAEIIVDYSSSDVLISPLPLTETYQLVARGGLAFSSGVSWAVAIVSGTFSGAAPSISGTGSGQLSINSGLASGEAQLRVTASIGGAPYPPMNVKVTKRVALPTSSGGGTGGTSNFASDNTLTSFSTSGFAVISDDLTIALPSGVTTATLTASSLSLRTATTNTPVGDTICEFKWQREASPGTWVDVGTVATSSPNPGVLDDGDGFRFRQLGSVTCNRSATGLGPGSTQKFRLVGRVSGGNVRTITLTGTVSAQA